MFGFKIITQYEKGVVFRFGRALHGTRAPGLTWVNPFADRLRKVNIQTTVAAVRGHEAITRDNELPRSAAAMRRGRPRLRWCAGSSRMSRLPSAAARGTAAQPG